MVHDPNDNGKTAGPASAELHLVLDVQTGHLSITGSVPSHEAALVMIRRAEYEYEKLIEKRPKSSPLVSAPLGISDFLKRNRG